MYIDIKQEEGANGEIAPVKCDRNASRHPLCIYFLIFIKDTMNNNNYE